jgi:phosphoribosylamine--glycine ligase
MKVLLIGSGGREHALAWKIARSPLLSELLIAPGNPGTAAHGRNVAVPVTDFAGIVALAQQATIDLVVVGPDNPLADGLVDRLQAAGVPAFGPTAAAARIEGSKAFAKAIMAEAGVPTAETHVFETPAAAASFAQESGRAWVVKADGLALGKGVIVAEDLADTLAAIEQLGATSAGRRLLLEERLVGREVSLLALCDGERLAVLPPARDYKRLLDGDAGPNTGGMGVFAPVDEVSPALLEEMVERCMRPVLRVLAGRGTPFRGVLYGGLILTTDGPKVLEYNARFGDPETQVVLPLIDGDLLAAMRDCALGRLDPQQLRVLPGYAVCVVLAATGYPQTPRRGDPITGLEQAAADPDLLVFQAGTAQGVDELQTNGGRVLGVTGLGATLEAARTKAYAGVSRIDFAERHYRHDIGA